MRYLLLSTFMLMTVISCRTEKPSAKPAYLDASYSVGPLCPVEPCDVSEEKMKAVYGAWMLLIYKQGTDELVKQVPFEISGHSLVELAPGNYTIRVPDSKTGFSKDLPKDVTLTAGQTTKLSVHVDTGIR